MNIAQENIKYSFKFHAFADIVAEAWNRNPRRLGVILLTALRSSSFKAVNARSSKFRPPSLEYDQ